MFVSLQLFHENGSFAATQLAYPYYHYWIHIFLCMRLKSSN